MRAMFNGDQARKRVLVDHGFRLPSALDNRPLRFEEIEHSWSQVVFVSATPSAYELEKTGGEVVEQVIRPTGLVDPTIEVRPATDQVSDFLLAARKRSIKRERTLATTLTKRMAEDLASYLGEQDLKCRYLHSEIQTLDRVAILRDLREGKYDVLIGVNLLREGLDLPEVSLVAIFDADKAGFLRSSTSLIQQIGRAARNVNATVILYADQITPAMRQAMDETDRRRWLQLAFNREHGITPRTIHKAIRRGIETELRAIATVRAASGVNDASQFDRQQMLTDLQKQMLKAADSLEFERAAMLRDQIKDLGKISTRLSGATTVRGKLRRPKPGTPRIKKDKKGTGVNH